jgi:hypothetical protein
MGYGKERFPMDSDKESKIIKQTLKELMGRWKNSRPKIIRLIPYARNSSQYIIGVIECSSGYEACIYLEDKLIAGGYESDNIDAYMKVILEKDNAFLDEIVQKAKDDIDNGKVK